MEDVNRFVEMVGNKQGWERQKNGDFLNSIKRGLLVNHQRHGYFLCPCRDGSGIREKDRDIICPCVYNVPDQKEHGHCLCGLFFAPQKQNKKQGKNQEKNFRQIPDRRPEKLYD